LKKIEIGDILFSGIIYQIWSEHDDSIGKVYIGQSQKSLEERWNGHVRDSKNLISKKNPSIEIGQAAKLHKAMNIIGLENIQKKQLEFYEYEDYGELLNKLNERENYFIEKYNCIEKGWNKQYAPKIKLTLGVNPKETWERIAKKHNVNVRRLTYQVNNNGLSIEDAVKAIKKLDQGPKKIFSYGMQLYNFIRELEVHNKHNVPIKTLERRIKNGNLKKTLNNNIETVFLVDSIFKPVNRPKEITVKTPDSKIVGKTIKELHDKLTPLYPDMVPNKYTTVQSRMIKKNWSNEQAFGFKYPPGYEEVEDLIENKDYQWGEIDGQIKIPNFKKDYKTKTKPIILNSIKVIYFSESDWCNAFKLTDRKMIKKLFDEGKAPEEVLQYYGRKY
jgi:hypothetical protein